MSSPSQFYSLVTLSDRVVPGFAGIMRASMMAGESPSSREIKVVIGSLSHVSEGKAISFAKKVTKHIRVGRRWSFVKRAYLDAVKDCWGLRHHILAERRRIRGFRRRGDFWMLRFLRLRPNRWAELQRVRQSGIPRVTPA